MAESSPQLDYSPKPVPWHRRRGVRRWVALTSMVALLLLAGWEWGPAAWRRLQVARWERTCMSYTAPPEQVVYEEGPASAKALFPVPDYCPVVVSGERFAVYRPRSLWNHLLAPFSDGLAFSHERSTPGGARRLVIVGVSVSAMAPRVRQDLSLPYMVIRPGSSGEVPELTGDRAVVVDPGVPGFAALGPGDRVRLYAGQPDPADATHFTIGYAVNGVPGTIDGWLGDDERVKLQVRDGPAKSP